LADGSGIEVIQHRVSQPKADAKKNCPIQKKPGKGLGACFDPEAAHQVGEEGLTLWLQETV
jgi:hypothetical protein